MIDILDGMNTLESDPEDESRWIMVGNSPSKKVMLGIVAIAVAVVAAASKNSVIEALA